MKETFPNFTFEASKFIQIPRNYWESESNRKNFFLEIAKKYHIKKPEEWGKITYLLVSTLYFNYFR